MLPITYYFSDLTNAYFAAYGNVVVAIYFEGIWQDRCIYRPLRDFYKPVPWSGVAYDPSIIIEDSSCRYIEWKYVQDRGYEMPNDLFKKLTGQ